MYWRCQFDTLGYPERIQLCRHLGAYWIVLSPTLLSQLDTLVPSALKTNRFSGLPAFWSPQTCFGPPHMCAVCVNFKDRETLRQNFPLSIEHVVPNLSLKLSQRCTKIVPMLSQSCPRVVSKWNHDKDHQVADDDDNNHCDADDDATSTADKTGGH